MLQENPMDARWTEENIIELLKKTVFDTFDIDLSDATPQTSVSDIGLDSMAVLDVIMTVEDTIGIKLGRIELPKNPSLQDVAAMVARNVEARADE